MQDFLESLIALRRKTVEAMAGEGYLPTPEGLAELAAINQSIAAVEAIMAEIEREQPSI